MTWYVHLKQIRFLSLMLSITDRHTQEIERHQKREQRRWERRDTRRREHHAEL
jgi:hypothetical protein